MATPIINAAKILGPQLAGKLLGKVDKRFDKFFDNAIVKGFSIDQAMGFLANQFGAGESDLERELAGRESQGQLRPDEEAALQNVREPRLPARTVQAAVAYGLPFALGSGEQPEEQAQQAQQAQAQPQQAQQKPQQKAPQAAGPSAPGMNTLMTKFPKLGEYLDGLIGNGHPPEQAAGMAKKESRFRKEVNEIENEVGLDFVEFISSLFRGSAQKSAPQAKGGVSDKQRAIIEKLKQRLNTM